MPPSRSVVDAIDKVRESLGALGVGGYEYPNIANGPIEEVLAFNNDEHIKLVEDAKVGLHFSSRGTLTDLQHRPIPDSAVETTFPVNKKDFPGAGEWPNAQDKPWTAPPLDDTNAKSPGPSKQAYFFNNRKDYFVTVGPSLPKITPLPEGGAQFWVGSIGVFTQGVGRFKGVHGVSVYIGSAYLPDWPDDEGKQLEILIKGFNARIGTYFKFVK